MPLLEYGKGGGVRPARCVGVDHCGAIGLGFHKLFFALRKPEGQTVDLVQTGVDVSGWEDAAFAAVVW